jgi:hypothetical protein
MSDIADLFTRDPENLTKDDIRAIIAKYREARQQFILGAKQAGAAKNVKRETPKITNLDDLEI